MDFSILVCTHNRAASLAKTLQQLKQLVVADRYSWEIIVIDNCSVDQTAAMLTDYPAQFPEGRFFHYYQPQIGLSHARNMAIDKAKGKLLLFTDDDVLPDQNWAEQLLATFDEFDCDACGGWIEPNWERPPPRWLGEALYGYIALKVDPTGSKVVSEMDDFPYGANMAFRREVFDRLGGFDAELGRKGTQLAGGEELDMFNRLIHSGGQIIYNPKAKVKHAIESFRMRKRYFLRWRFDDSFNRAKSFGMESEKQWFGAPRFLLRQWLHALLRALVSQLSTDRTHAVEQWVMLAHFSGLIAGLRARSRALRAVQEVP